ncbi:MAG TPA: hypothetical protein VJS45_16215 [Acidimicrobiia bacterium]|nr:hypothetical protein [Acidimicrobiia bacterium]
MHLRPFFVVAVATLAAVFVSAGPASAHEEISPTSFPTGQATFLTLTVANEASVDLVRVALRGPAGVAFGEATRSPAGWSATATDDTVTWTGGAVKPHTFESWGFEIGGADQPATLTYRVTLGYAGGKTDEHEVEVTATAPGSGAAASPATTSTTIATATSADAPTATSAAAPAGSEGRSDSDSGTATAALVISIVALVLAAGALINGRRRGGGPVPDRAAGGDTAAGAAQDW